MYDRKPHRFSARDLARVAGSIEPPSDLEGLFSLIITLWEIELILIEKAFAIVPFFERFPRLLPLVRRILRDVWQSLTSNSSVPADLEGIAIVYRPLQGGLSRLDYL